jgi:hypothetical protein
MKQLIIAGSLGAIALSVLPVAANARSYVFDCGGQKTPDVILSGRYVRVGVYRINSIATFEISIGGIAAQPTIVRTPIFQWDQGKDEATLNGQHCRLLTQEEVNGLADPQFGAEHDTRVRK